jgi:hypothetical protein
MGLFITKKPTSVTSTTTALKLADTYTAGEALTANDAVYIKTADGKAYKAQADGATNESEAYGIAQTTVTQDDDIAITFLGLQDGFSSLSIGNFYFLSETAGALTTTAPTTAGSTVVRIGRAESDDRLSIKPQIIGVRS